MILNQRTKAFCGKSVEAECVIDEADRMRNRWMQDVEPAGTLAMCWSRSQDELNALTIYTDLPAYFHEFAETMYEKTGLVSLIVSKKRLGLAKNKEKNSSIFLLDFEWNSALYEKQIALGKHYIPIHKNPGGQLKILTSCSAYRL
ncbi:MAG: hypothetical protein ACLVCH_01415 [Roseburia inulinivorans]